MPLDIREWTCPNCGIHHSRDGNASANIRAEGIRMLALTCTERSRSSAVEMIKAEGSAVSAVGGEVSPTLGRKSKFRHSPMITEAPSSAAGN